MKTIIITTIAVLVLLIGAPVSAFAQTELLPHSDHPQTAYRSGYEHGVIDAHQPDTTHWYILEPGHNFAFHTQEFNDGYVAAMCKAGISSDANEATWTCEVPLRH